MNILYVNPGSEDVGTAFRMFPWAKQLVKKGHKVTIICSYLNPSLRLFKIKYRDGVRVINLIKTKCKWDYPGYIIRAFIAVILCVFLKFDVLHSLGVTHPASTTAILTVRLLRILRLKKALIVSDWDDWWGGEDGIAREHIWFVHKYISFMERFMWCFIDYLTVCSEFLKNEAIKSGFNEKKVFKILHGADIDVIKPILREEARKKLNLPEDKIILEYIGKFHPSTNLMMEAFKNVVTKNSNVILLMLGKLPENIFQGYKELEKYIITKGMVPHTEIPLYLGAADVFLLPMENTNIERARLPIRLGEYMAAGRPIIATFVAGSETSRIITEDKFGILSAQDDHVDFANDILALISDKEKLKKMGMYARESAVRKFGGDNLIKELLEIYSNSKL